MSKEIEEFEQRVQKVDEYIRADDLVELCNLVVNQLGASLSVVKELASPDSKQVFKQHQHNRLQRFEKLILTFVQYKQTEILEKDKMEEIEVNSIL
jgi:hypothetical protein